MYISTNSVSQFLGKKTKQNYNSYKEDRKKELRGRSRKPPKKNGILEKGEIRCDNYGIPCIGVRGKSLTMDIIIVSNMLITWYSLPSQLRRQTRSGGLGHPFFGGKCPGGSLECAMEVASGENTVLLSPQPTEKMVNLYNRVSCMAC